MTMGGVSDLKQQLAGLDARLNPGAYVFVTLDEGRKIDASAIIATMREPAGNSAVIEAAAAAAAGLPPSPLFAWITLSVHSDLQSVGLTATFSGVLRTAGIGCNVIAGARHDHIFVPAAQADRAMSELRALQRRPEVTFWTVWEGDTLLGCGALQALDAHHGEIKSMRTASAHRRKGAARAMLDHIIAEAGRRGYARLSLETGSHVAFKPAHALYASRGFSFCEPFAPYKPDPYSVFMTRTL
jgi:putative acetyltransferase